MNICTGELVPLFELVGIVLNLFKLFLPIIIIILGTFDLYKAITGNEDSVLKKQIKRFIYRVVAAILIFFIPNIVLFIFSMIGVEQNECVTCVLNTKKCNIVQSGTNSNNSSNSNSNNNNLKVCTIEDESCISNAIYIEGN